MEDVVVDEEKVNKKEAKKAAKAEKKARKKASKKNPIFKILAILVVLSAILAMIYLDVFGIRSNFLNSTLEKVPVINNLLPPTDGASKKSKEELQAEIDLLTSQLEATQAEVDSLQKNLIESQGEVARLRLFEEEKLQFTEDKEAFDTMVANENPAGYIAFYESIYPETADEIYRSLRGQEIDNELLDDYIARFENMKANSAADILTEMIYTDLDIVILVLDNLSNKKSADILAGMTPTDAATIVKRMSPITN